MSGWGLGLPPPPGGGLLHVRDDKILLPLLPLHRRGLASGKEVFNRRRPMQPPVELLVRMGAQRRRRKGTITQEAEGCAVSSQDLSLTVRVRIIKAASREWRVLP